MKQCSVLTIVLAVFLAGCSQEEAAESAPAEASVAASSAAPESMAPWEGDESWRNAGFMQHMHEHAERLDDVNFALADGNLEAAMTPAEWLATHDTYDDVQADWLPYLYAMRNEAEALVAATDIETARAASERINEQCQSCHTAVGMETFEQ